MSHTKLRQFIVKVSVLGYFPLCVISEYVILHIATTIIYLYASILYTYLKQLH